MYKSLKEVFGKKKSYEEIFAPVSGKCVPMGQVNDPTFSQEILGKGVAIIPSEGKVSAPGDGEILMGFETRHAVSIRLTGGAELIIHIGLDTVNLHGEYFTSHVKAGDKVKKGDLLIEFDMDKIKEQGYDLQYSRLSGTDLPYRSRCENRRSNHGATEQIRLEK